MGQRLRYPFLYAIFCYFLFPLLPFFTPLLPLLFPLTYSLKHTTAPRLYGCACGSGLLIDLFSSHLPLGAHAAFLCFTLALVRRFEHLFFTDKVAPYFLLSSLFSFLFSLFTFCAHLMADRPLALSFPFLLTDAFLAPLFDGLFCTVSALLFTFVPLSVKALLSWIQNIKVIYASKSS